MVEGLGEPTGPARAVATLVRDEWRMECASPEWVGLLLGEALGESEGGGTSRE